MKRNYLLATALAIMTLASCSENDYVGDQQALTSAGDGAITFGFDVPNPTRAGGATAATALGNQFIVWGEKGEAATDCPLIFHAAAPIVVVTVVVGRVRIKSASVVPAATLYT